MYSANQSSLVSARGDFFGAWPWDHYATLTFARQLSESTCIRHWDDFINSLGRLTHGRVAWVRADERTWSGYASPEIPFHYHALLKHQNVPASEDVAALWKSRAGDAKVEAHNCGGGAAYHIAKMFPYEDTRYDMGGLEDFARPQKSDRPLIQRMTGARQKVEKFLPCEDTATFPAEYVGFSAQPTNACRSRR